jgi:periplasmic divalent cation tolerance protein
MNGVSDLHVILVLVTTATEKEAADIATTLVEREEAACVNIVPMVRSVYRWKGTVSSETEQLLLVKTTQALLEDVKKTVRELHTYELPELIAINVDDGDRNALNWIGSVVKGGRENF